MRTALRESDQQFAAVISTRRRQIVMRLLLPVIVAPIYTVFTGSFIAAAAWVLGYFLLQVLEVWIFPRGLIERRMEGGRWRGAALAVVAANGVIFGSFGIVAAVFGGPWGAACGALWVSGAILNAVLTSVGCRPVFTAALLPQIGYFVILAFLAMPLGASLGQAVALAVTAGVNVIAALLAWQLYQRLFGKSPLGDSGGRLDVIQARDVDRAKPWPDGPDRQEDQALSV